MENKKNDHLNEATREIEKVAIGLIARGIDVETIRGTMNIVSDRLEYMKEERHKKALKWAINMAKDGESIELIESLTRVGRNEFIEYVDHKKRKEKEAEFKFGRK
jgi:hypothetical protein